MKHAQSRIYVLRAKQLTFLAIVAAIPFFLFIDVDPSVSLAVLSPSQLRAMRTPAPIPVVSIRDIFGEELVDPPTGENPTNTRRRASLAEFSSTAQQLVLVRAATTFWNKDQWLIGRGDFEFQFARSCSRDEKELPDASADSQRSGELDPTVDVVITRDANFTNLLMTLLHNKTDTANATELGVVLLENSTEHSLALHSEQELRIVNVYHAWDVIVQKHDVVDTDGIDQLRLLMSREAGVYSRGIYDKAFRSQFHMGATSQLWSESADPASPLVFWPYLYNPSDWFRPPRIGFDWKKTDALALFVHRNCNTPVRRERFVREMQKHIQIDAPGECLTNMNNTELPGRQLLPRIPEEILAEYKFGFAIENQLCRGYVTEKFHTAVSAGVVPVVMSYRDPATGLQYPNYDDYAPKDATHAPNQSYIDLADFDSAESASRFIRAVGSHAMLYNEFLWYRFVDKQKQKEILEEMRVRDVVTLVADFRNKRTLCNFARKVVRHDTKTRLGPITSAECQNNHTRWSDVDASGVWRLGA